MDKATEDSNDFFDASQGLNATQKPNRKGVISILTAKTRRATYNGCEKNERDTLRRGLRPFDDKSALVRRNEGGSLNFSSIKNSALKRKHNDDGFDEPHKEADEDWWRSLIANAKEATSSATKSLQRGANSTFRQPKKPRLSPSDRKSKMHYTSLLELASAGNKRRKDATVEDEPRRVTAAKEKCGSEESDDDSEYSGIETWTVKMAPVHLLQDTIHEFLHRRRDTLSDPDKLFLQTWAVNVFDKQRHYNQEILESMELVDAQQEVSKKLVAANETMCNLQQTVLRSQIANQQLEERLANLDRRNAALTSINRLLDRIDAARNKGQDRPLKVAHKRS
jgi:hypothetical protein